MISALIVLLSITVLFQSNENRMHVAMAFVGGILLHEFFYSHLEGFDYHASSALVSLISLAIIVFISASKLAKRLSLILLLMIIADMAGYYLWYLYVSPIFYNTAIGVLFFAAAICLCKGDGDVGRSHDRAHLLYHRIRNYFNSRYSSLH